MVMTRCETCRKCKGNTVTPDNKKCVNCGGRGFIEIVEAQPVTEIPKLEVVSERKKPVNSKRKDIH